MDNRNGVPERHQASGREAFLAIILAVFVGFGAVVFLVFVSGGFFAYVILIGAGMAVLGGLHYLVWGWAMPPAENEVEQPPEDDDDEPPPTPWERRF
jgi:hypothetical protein